MRCSSCNAENPADNRFCDQCGASLGSRCPNCGKEARSGAKFCGACGHSLDSDAAASEPAPEAVQPTRHTDTSAPYTPRHLAEKILTSRSALEGERRQVTVLFADIAGFTSMAEKLDPEEVHGIINRCFEIVTAEVHRFEGTINQYTGDGVMSLFGAPIAHEDSPRRAVHAALAIQRGLGEYSRELEGERGFGIHMRIGLNTGTVVVGKIGDDLRMDYTAVGDTTNLAARLQQAAQPDQILMSETTCKLVSGFFETADHGTIKVKGHELPIHVYEVLRTRGRRSALAAAAEHGLTPLVGREREVEALLDRFEQTKKGQGQVVFIVGEPGIGKSRLVYELRHRLAEGKQNASWLEGRCVSFGQSIPFLPVIDQVREALGVDEHDGEPEIIAKIDQMLRELGGLEAYAPYLRNLMSVDPGDPTLALMDAAVRRKRTFDALRAVGLGIAAHQPAVFVFEDLHWIDTSTSEYLNSCMDVVAAAPILLVLTCRVGYQPPFVPRSYFTTINLRSLTEQEAAQMAGRVLGTDEFPAQLRTALMEKAEGVPLFIEEVTKTLLDLGVLRRDDGRYRMVKGVEDVDIPQTMQGIIMARLDRLGENGKRTVQLASVIGRQFLQRLLERVAELPGELEGLLQELKSLELIYQQGLLQEPAYVFKHAVIQDVAYGSLLLQRRRELHKLVGVAIEDLYADRLADHYGELAHHFSQAEEWPKAVEYSLLAGDRAAWSYANREAVEHYSGARDAAERRGPSHDPDTFVSVLCKLGGVLSILAEYKEAIETYLRALDLVRQLGDRNREMKVLVGLSDVYNFKHEGEPALDYNEQALAIARETDNIAFQATCLANRVSLRSAGYGQIIETTPDAEEALRLATKAGDRRILPRALAHLGAALQWRGHYDQGIRYLREGATAAEEVHDGFFFGYCAFMLGNALAAKGEYDQALSWYRRLSDYANSAGDKFYMARAPNLIAGVHLELFDLDHAVRLNLEAAELATQHWSWPEPRCHALLKAGVAQLQKGEYGRAEELFRQASDLLEVDTWYRWRWHIPLLRAQGQLALVLGRPDEAWKFAERSLVMATETDSRKHVARAQLLQGRIQRAAGRLEDAELTMRRSLASAEQIGAQQETWRAGADLADVLLELGKDDEAETMLEGAAGVIGSIAGKLSDKNLQQRFLEAEPVVAVYRALGQRPRPG
jgi:class 3 adenylate cyclase/tetratricopeptide (TPR) repeat protein